MVVPFTRIIDNQGRGKINGAIKIFCTGEDPWLAAVNTRICHHINAVLFRVCLVFDQNPVIRTQADSVNRKSAITICCQGLVGLIIGGS